MTDNTGDTKRNTTSSTEDKKRTFYRVQRMSFPPPCGNPNCQRCGMVMEVGMAIRDIIGLLNSIPSSSSQQQQQQPPLRASQNEVKLQNNNDSMEDI